MKGEEKRRINEAGGDGGRNGNKDNTNMHVNESLEKEGHEVVIVVTITSWQ